MKTVALEDRRMYQYFTRISVTEDDVIRRAADKVGVKPSVFGRDAILAEARRVLGEESN